MSNSARIDELRIKFEDNNRRYFAPLANEYRKVGDLAQAIALCREHLPHQPGHMSGYIVFGQALYEAGELTEAESVFTQALELDPENLIALRHLGDIAAANGDTLTAERWFGRVLDADPRNNDIAAQLASLVSARVATPRSAPIVFTPPDSSYTPAFGVPFGALGAMPTPDAAMRSIDPDAVTKPSRSYAPLDIDELGGLKGAPTMESASSVDAPANPPAIAAVEADSVSDSDADEVPWVDAEDEEGADAEVDVPFALEADPVAEIGSAYVADTEANAEVMSDDDSDPFAYPIESEIARRSRDSGAYGSIASTDESMENSDDPSAELDDAEQFEEFEAGLIAPLWPDTSDLVMRVVQPRTPTPATVTPSSLTPVSTSAYEDAPAAFGRETTDPVGVPVIYDASATDEVDAIEAEVIRAETILAETVLAETVHEEAINAELIETNYESIEVQDAPSAESTELSYIISAEEFAEDDADEFSVDMTDNVSAREQPVASGMFDDTSDVAGEDLVTITAEDTVHDSTGEANADSHGDAVFDVESTVNHASDSSPDFEEISAALASDAAAAGDDSTVYVEELEANDEHPPEYIARPTPAAASAAFVTETMAELLVSQGFTARAIEVYQELVRRRPYDPVLTSRLQQLQESLHDLEAESPTNVVADAEETNDANGAMESSVEMGSDLPVATAFQDAWHDADENDRIADEFAEAIIEQRLTPVVNPAVPTPAYFTPAFSTPFLQPAFATVQDSQAARPTARDVFAALASRRVPRRTPPQSFTAVAEHAEGLSSLFGNDSLHTEDAAARALADAFAPVTDEDYGDASSLDFELNRSTPAFSHLVTPSEPQPAVSATPTPSYGQAQTPQASTNEGFSFDRFFPDPATRSGTPASSSPTISSSASPDNALPDAMDPPVTDDLAQFSQWLKGLNRS